jgi:hypothetical protein
MPRLQPRLDESGAIVDVEISYPADLEAQMLEYSAQAREGESIDVLQSPAAPR